MAGIEHRYGGNEMSDQLIQKVQTGMWVKVRGSQPGQENFEEVFHFVANDQVASPCKTLFEQTLLTLSTQACSGWELTNSEFHLFGQKAKDNCH